MKQYEFEAVNRKRGNIERIRATAKTEAIARAHIVDFYGTQFEVAGLCCDVNPPHSVLGEIDCTSPGCEEFALNLIAKAVTA
jgi:hypothetical protein